MCGIIGFVGPGSGIDTVLDGLCKLEYRGYDSAGLAYLSGQARKDSHALQVTNHKSSKDKSIGKNIPANQINFIKSVGHVKRLAEKVRSAHPPADREICIGHTRWATHGAVTENNAHPHKSADGRFAVVHNGIIENYRALIAELASHGIHMQTDTDTEVIPNLIQYYYNIEMSARRASPADRFASAVHKALERLCGSYAIAVLSAEAPDTLICAKHGMPLCIGAGADFSYITSDIPTALTKTDTIYVLENDEIAVAAKDKPVIFYKNEAEIKKQPVKKSGSRELITKGEFSTYMEKEINDIPEVFERLIAHYVKRGDKKGPSTQSPIPPEIISRLRTAQCVHICACGTAYHAGLVLSALLEKHAKIRTKTHIASEFRYNDPLLHKSDVGVIISQSGETADTIAAMQLMRDQNIPTVAFCNTDNSTIARAADYYLPTLAGFEIAVASTKAYCAQVLLSAILVNEICRTKVSKVISDRYKVIGTVFSCLDFSILPSLVRGVISGGAQIRTLAESHKDIARVFFIGKGLDASAGLEAALKVKEITYMQCEGYPAGELKHGTLSLVDDNTLTVAFATTDDRTVNSKTENALAEVKARGSKTWTISAQTDAPPTPAPQESTICNRKTPQSNDTFHLSPITSHLNLPASPLAFTYTVIPAQLFALYLAQIKGYDPDKPRNLAKSVTVE
jgi:glucosamine--fructose-6-phosphate aminotransferase (isomerizing)